MKKKLDQLETNQIQEFIHKKDSELGHMPLEKSGCMK